MTKEQDPNRILREAKSTLVVSGRALLFFSAWGFIKSVFGFLYEDEWDEVRRMVLREDLAIRITALIVVLVTALLVTGVYLYVGFSAVREGHGKKKSDVYLVAAAILLLISTASLALDAYSWWLDKTSIIHLAQIVVESTFFVAVLDLLTAAGKLRKYRILEEKEG